MAGFGALCGLVVCPDLLLWAKSWETPLALDNAWINVRRAALACDFSRLSRLSAFFQFLHCNLWLAWGHDDVACLATRHRADVPDRWRDQRSDRACRGERLSTQPSALSIQSLNILVRAGCGTGGHARNTCLPSVHNVARAECRMLRAECHQ